MERSKMKWTRNWAPVGQKNKVHKEKGDKEVIKGFEMEISLVGTAMTTQEVMTHTMLMLVSTVLRWLNILLFAF